MLLKHTMVFWKKCTAKHECEELQEGGWLEPIHATLRRKTNEARTDEHRNVTKKLVVQGGWVQKHFMTCDGRTKRSVKVVTKKKALRSPGCTTVHDGGKSETRSQKQRTETSKEDWTWPRGTTLHPLSEGSCKKSHLSVHGGESEAHKSWSMSAEGFRDQCHHRWLSVGSPGQVACVRMVSGAARS